MHLIFQIFIKGFFHYLIESMQSRVNNKIIVILDDIHNNISELLPLPFSKFFVCFIEFRVRRVFTHIIICQITFSATNSSLIFIEHANVIKYHQLFPFCHSYLLLYFWALKNRREWVFHIFIKESLKRLSNSLNISRSTF